MESGINKLLLFILIGRWLFAQVVFSDSFEDISIWNMIHSEDVEITLTTEQDVENRTLLRLDYNFKSGAGYCGIGRKAIIDYPENYRFRFGLQGTGSSNNLEFKLIDETGENVWWKIVRNLSLPAERKEFVARKREIEFAWGPIHDHTLWRSTEIQLIISSAEGGSGTLWIDNLVLESYQTLPINKIQPIVKLNGKEENNHGFFDQKRESCRKKMFSRSEKVEIDLCGNVELGGMVIYWDPVCVDGIYQLRFSENGENWTPTLSDGIDQTGVSWIRLTDMDTRYIQLELKKPRVSARMGIQEIEYIAPEKAADMNSWLKNRVERAKYGDYPRYMFNQASYWTVIGNVDDDREVLMNTDGQVETGNRGFLLEPVVIMNSKIVTWADVVTEQTLEGQYLPIPTVIWHHPEFMMEETALISGNPGESQLFIRYVFTPQKVSTSKCQMAVVGRPFQVNPDYQSLGYPGGFVPVYSIESNGNILNVNETRRIDLMQGADCIRLFDNHDGIGLSEILEKDRGKITAVQDSLGLASFAVLYDLPLTHSDTIVICVPLYSDVRKTIEPGSLTNDDFRNAMEETVLFWTEKLNVVRFELPQKAMHYLNTFRSNLAYILINRDRDGIQPGSRSYERSWIRDGSLTSSALLKGGLFVEPCKFIEWFGSFQFDSGKIPCVIDRRGPDPVPENDSHGQYIFAIAEYHRFTQDHSFLAQQYPRVQRAVQYIDQQRSLRRNEYYQSGNDSLRCLYGLMPESISHEGYMDKPRHSYWDDFFTLKGLKDAVIMAEILEDSENVVDFRKIRDEFIADFYVSIDCSQKRHGIDYIPGCAELGDFDATSTTIGLWPAGEWDSMVQHGGHQTFERYYDFFQQRRISNVWNNYTPYEIRTVGSFLYMGLPAVSMELLDFFFEHQRPSGWNQWAEVVSFNPDTVRFIGDMPHTWVGSDYINAFRSLFVFEEPETDRLILASGIPFSWIQEETGISVTDLPTHYGNISYRIQLSGNEYVITVSSLERMPTGGIVIPGYSLIYPENAMRTSKTILLKRTDVILFEAPKIVTLKK